MASASRKRCNSLGASILAGVVAVACSSAVDAGSALESISVQPPTATVAVGANLQLTAELRDSDGTIITGQRVSWASEDATIASVSQAGVVTGVRVGTVLIAASTRGLDAFARVTVSPSPVASVRVATSNRTMFVGEVEQLTAEPLDDAGQVLPGRVVTWTSSNTSVATVTASGLVTAVAAGGTIITASSEGKSAVVSITVSTVPVSSVALTPTSTALVVGQTAQLTATPRDASGAALGGRVVIWSTSNAQVASVTSQGVVTAIAPGSATITATSEGRSATASVSVNPRPASAIILSPNQVTIFAGQTIQLSAIVTDDRGQVLPGKAVTFASGNTQVATVSSAGLVTAVSTGTATITATSDAATGTASVTVAPEPIAAVEVVPSSVSIFAGQPFQLVAVPKNSAGQPLSLVGRTVTWNSSTPSIATVTSTGMVTGVSAGSTVVVATVDGKQGASVVSVRLVPVATVLVSPPSTSLTVGQSLTLTATTLDAAGNTLSGRIVGWSSSDNTIATVSSGGVVTAVAPGAVSITATSEGQSGSSAVTVTAVPVATVAVNPPQPSVTVGQSVQLTATPLDANGQPLTGRTTTWTSSASSVATVSTAGLVTGVSSGTAAITATVDGVAGSATVIVNAPAAATVTVAPSTATVNLGSTTTLTATVRDAAGAVIIGAPVTWTSSAPSVATVSGTGVVSAVAAGSATITATSGTASGTATVSVPAPQVARIVVTPTNAQVKEGHTLQMTATLYDANNNIITGVSVTWSSSNTSRATVDSTGLVTGIRDGNVVITASAGGKSGSTAVRVED